MQNLLDPSVFPYLLTFVVLIANIISFTVYRIYRTLQRTDGRARLQVWSTSRSGKMAYLVSGPLSQPHTAFKSVLPDLIHDGVTMVNYQNSGFDPLVVAKQIYEDIGIHDYDATIYAFSTGDQVARWVGCWLMPDVRTIAIRPCSSPKFLRPHMLILSTIAAVLMQFISNLLGWLSLVPLIPAHGSWYSILLLTDQLSCLINKRIPKCDYEDMAPDGMLIDMHNKSCRNSVITSAYPDAAYIIMMRGKIISQDDPFINDDGSISSDSSSLADDMFRFCLRSLTELLDKEEARNMVTS